MGIRALLWLHQQHPTPTPQPLKCPELAAPGAPAEPAPALLNIKTWLNIKTKLPEDKSQAEVTTHSNLLRSCVSKRFVTGAAWALGKSRGMRAALN